MIYTRQILSQKAFAAIVCTTLLLFSCAKGPDFVKSHGPQTIETRVLTSFHAIQSDKKFIVFISQDSSMPEQVTISYGKHLLAKIKTEIEDGVLVLRDENTFNWVRKLDVNPVCTVNVKKLDRLEALGASQMICLDTIIVNDIKLNMNSVALQQLKFKANWIYGSASNAGTIKLSGTAFGLSWTCENGSWLDASKLPCSDIYVYHFTNRNMYVNPVNVFKAQVKGDGNVYYSKDPKLVFEKSETGKGKVIKL